MSLEHLQFRFHKAQPLQEHQQSQLYRAPRLHRQHKLFNIRRTDQRTAECKHLSRTRIPTKQAADGKNGGTNFSLVLDISASQILRITSMLFTFTGEKKMRELVESLESVLHRHQPSSQMNRRKSLPISKIILFPWSTQTVPVAS